ncbi:GNAT family N-acetyltransferase [Blautia sp. HCP28S3_G10]
MIVLHVLAVHPDHRGKGLARRLVENVIEQERKAVSYLSFLYLP